MDFRLVGAVILAWIWVFARVLSLFFEMDQPPHWYTIPLFITVVLFCASGAITTLDLLEKRLK